MKKIIVLLILAGILFFTKTDSGKQFWFDVFRTFSKEHNINCSNPNVLRTLYGALKENEIYNAKVSGITTIVDTVRYKKCTALLDANGKNLLGIDEQVKNLPIEYEVRVTDDGKSFTVYVKER